jgi:hypothetical protein
MIDPPAILIQKIGTYITNADPTSTIIAEVMVNANDPAANTSHV